MMQKETNESEIEGYRYIERTMYIYWRRREKQLNVVINRERTVLREKMKGEAGNYREM